MDELDKMSRMVKWYVAIAAVLVTAFVLCAGCDVVEGEKVTLGLDGHVRIASLQGHDYVIARGGNGIAIVHAASCQCQEAVPHEARPEAPKSFNDSLILLDEAKFRRLMFKQFLLDVEQGHVGLDTVRHAYGGLQSLKERLERLCHVLRARDNLYW